MENGKVSGKNENKAANPEPISVGEVRDDGDMNRHIGGKRKRSN